MRLSELGANFLAQPVHLERQAGSCDHPLEALGLVPQARVVDQPPDQAPARSDLRERAARGHAVGAQGGTGFVVQACPVGRGQDFDCRVFEGARHGGLQRAAARVKVDHQPRELRLVPLGAHQPEAGYDRDRGERGQADREQGVAPPASIARGVDQGGTEGADPPGAGDGERRPVGGTAPAGLDPEVSHEDEHGEGQGEAGQQGRACEQGAVGVAAVREADEEVRMPDQGGVPREGGDRADARSQRRRGQQGRAVGPARDGRRQQPDGRHEHEWGSDAAEAVDEARVGEGQDRREGQEPGEEQDPGGSGDADAMRRGGGHDEEPAGEEQDCGLPAWQPRRRGRHCHGQPGDASVLRDVDGGE